MTAKQLARVVTCTAALAATLSGCQTGGAAASPAQPTTNVGLRAVPSTGGARAASTPAPAASPTRSCGTAELSVAPAAHEMKQGLDIERFTVTTSTPAGCTLAGVPNLIPKGPLSAQVPGAAVDLAVSQWPFPTDIGVDTGSASKVALLPGKPASFYLAWFSASTVVCVQSNGFGFNVPNDTTYGDAKLVTYPVGSLCDGIFYASSVFQG